MKNPSDCITVDQLKKMFIAGAAEIDKHYEYINELNVFPVPDGDTGINMKITSETACEAIRFTQYEDTFTLGKQFSRGLLMGARGNSGVILSQIFKGFCAPFVEGQKTVDVEVLKQSFVKAKEIAYRSVATPVEGTILTIIRVISEELPKAKVNSVKELFKVAIEIGEKTLEKTPDMLPELKEVGVVDSGGYGLCKFLHGMYNELQKESGSAKKPVKEEKEQNVEVKKNIVPNINDNNNGFGYCNEFIMTIGSKVEITQPDKEKFDLTTFRAELEKLGDSLVVVAEDEIVKVHIHSTKPYEILKFGARFGEFNKVKVENMTLQFLEKNPGTTLESFNKKKNNSEENIFKNNTSDEIRIVASVPSDNFKKIYKNEFAIEETFVTANAGNPSVQDFINLIQKSGSKKIIILLDDGNYLFAANEAAKLLPKEITCTVINAHDISAAYLLALTFNPHIAYLTNVKNMNKRLTKISNAKISKAVKNVKYSHINVHKDDYIGIVGKKIISSGKNFHDIVEKSLSAIVSKKTKTIYVFYGADLHESELEKINEVIRNKYTIKPIIINGSQKNYFLTFSVE
ncbi:MAG: DAK2 domain-containing protein [Mycoplasmataceae bacterium]|jgi:DAK2 domain fusion protein YloV|nr:DAK2 domain-containing protein [Mycoplasmataceae bacterium]